ncbi:pyridoxamine 5'-phosphate oxidase family protein [Candidatus Binatia bacterium]|nr:pyridoxamine 5'-phosphate oxidase family protein [Candidatus Binatia bacterium]
MARTFLATLATPAVLHEQERYYGRSHPVTATAPVDPLGAREAEFIAARDSFYMASIGEAGWPYVQHRGGPVGFLRVVSPTTLAFADYGGNRQLLTAGNLTVDDRVSLFLMDYAHRRRLKILGHARVADVREHPELLEHLAVEDGAEVERVVTIDVVSFDWNCPQHITQRFTAAEVLSVVEPLQREVERLRRLIDRGVPPTAQDD